MEGPHKFSAPIEVTDNGAYVVIPFDVEAAFGKKRVPVRATIDGVPYSGSLVRMGGDCHVLGVLKEIRTALGKGDGDVVEVVLEEDVAARVVEVPPDLETALRSALPAARSFESLSYSHKREYVSWIEEAKRESTRRVRIDRAIEMLTRRENRR